METTRGNRAVPKGVTRETEVERLTAAIHRALKTQRQRAHSRVRAGPHAGNPRAARLADARGQTQAPAHLHRRLEPRVTEIYDLEAHRTHRQHSNLQLREALNLVVLEKGQAENMKLSGGRIFVITAGMMSENTAAHDLATRMIGDERQAIFFVGYADPDTRGPQNPKTPLLILKKNFITEFKMKKKFKSNMRMSICY